MEKVISRRIFLHAITFSRFLSMSSSLRDQNMKVGVVQLTSTSDKTENFHKATDLIMKAKSMGAQVIFLPECFDYVSENRTSAIENAELITGDLIKKYSEFAQKESLWLSLGGFHEKVPEESESKIYNTHVLIDDKGDLKGKYSKLHLFDVDVKGRVRLKETDFTLKGRSLIAPVETPVGNIGMGICYDLRFPELSTALVQQGADILTYPSAFTVPTGKAHWEILLRSRAIENQCYVIAAAQVGKHNTKRTSYGHSMIVDPWGKISAEETSDHPGVLVTDIDLNYLRQRRIEMPVQTHRRFDIFGDLQAKNSEDIRNGDNTTTNNIDNCEQYTFGQYSVKNTSVFYKTALTYAFVNRKPVLPGHVLISPIRCTRRFCDLTPSETSDLWLVAQKVGSVIEKQYSCNSLTLCIQDGPEAGQTVEHVHVHICPRREGDFKENDDIYDKLEKHDHQVKDHQWRSDEDMAAEAGQLRKYFC